MTAPSQSESYKAETTASDEQLYNRNKLSEMFLNSPLPHEDLLFNLGLYTRSSLLVKFLVMNQVYERVKNIPGMIMELGVWYGQNIILLENLRAIHEPFNKQRKIVGFDTFTGYENFSENDIQSKVFGESSYSTELKYKEYLEELIKVHEGNNVLGHITGTHKLVAGDVTETVPQYFSEHKESIVALAYFDIGTYNPTLSALTAIKPHLVPGSVILLDELTWEDSPGEAIAFKEVFSDAKYSIEKVECYPSKSIVTIL